MHTEEPEFDEMLIDKEQMEMYINDRNRILSVHAPTTGKHFVFYYKYFITDEDKLFPLDIGCFAQDGETLQELNPDWEIRSTYSRQTCRFLVQFANIMGNYLEKIQYLVTKQELFYGGNWLETHTPALAGYQPINASYTPCQPRNYCRFLVATYPYDVIKKLAIEDLSKYIVCDDDDDEDGLMKELNLMFGGEHIREIFNILPDDIKASPELIDFQKQLFVQTAFK